MNKYKQLQLSTTLCFAALFVLMNLNLNLNLNLNPNPNPNQEVVVFDNFELPDLSNITPLVGAHSHNDYENKHPLWDALANGFTSIEVDVHLIRNELFVSHLRPLFPNPERTLTKLYLEPLYELFKQNKGQFYSRTDDPIYLMIDIKSNKNKTYQQLKKLIEPYQEMFSYWENEVEHCGAVRIILSGNRPIKKVQSERKRWVQIDGRVWDLGKAYSNTLMPMVSDKYSNVCTFWNCDKKPSHRKLEKLKAVAARVEAEGKRFRLWKSPENEIVWETLLQEGVHFINTDSLPMLSSFLQKSKAG